MRKTIKAFTFKCPKCGREEIKKNWEVTFCNCTGRASKCYCPEIKARFAYYKSLLKDKVR